jgi:hypothetical protein
MCLNEQVKRAKDSALISNLCRLTVSKKACSYHHGVDQWSALMDVNILDIEDLHRLGQEKK